MRRLNASAVIALLVVAGHVLRSGTGWPRTLAVVALLASPSAVVALLWLPEGAVRKLFGPARTEVEYAGSDGQAADGGGDGSIGGGE